MIAQEWIQALVALSLSQLCRGVLVDRSERNYKEIPQRLRNAADLTEWYGYPAEQHEVSTADGYTLTIFRIPRPGGIPVLMQHGIFLNADQWVLRGTHDLPFLLFERGFDVWMGSTRGTRYGKHHKYSINQYQYWKFTGDDIALNDLPSMIDYIVNATAHSKISYIGHSRGSNGIIMLLSDKPEYKSKIHMMQLLAPVIYTKYAECPLYYIAGNRSSTFMSTNTFGKLTSMTKTGRILNFPAPLRLALQAVCGTGTFDYLCPFLYFFINGEDFVNFNYTLTPKMLDHFTEGMGTMEVNHLLQISSANRFQKYDYGAKRNLKLYGTETPSEYNISAIDTPMYIYVGANDLFLSKKDLKKFTSQTRSLVSEYLVPWPRFNHIDYFWGNNANQILFPRFLRDIQRFHQTHRLKIS